MPIVEEITVTARLKVAFRIADASLTGRPAAEV